MPRPRFVLVPVVLITLSGCGSGEFSSWPENCHCKVSRLADPARLDVRCPDAQGNGRGLAIGLPGVAHTQGWYHGSLVISRAGKIDMYVEGLDALTEFGARVDHDGEQMYPVAVHRAYFPETDGYEIKGDLTEKMNLAESRLENATFWCGDADAP